MTPAERKLLAFIERYMAEHDGRAPSFEEMRAGINMASISTVHRTLGKLQQAGRIRRTSAWRSIEIVGLPPALIALTDEALLAEVARRGLAATHEENGRG